MGNTSINLTEENQQQIENSPVLVADVGGTKVRMGIDYGTDKAPECTEYEVAKHSSFEEIVVKYCSEKGVFPKMCVIGAAGCVDEINQTVRGSNSSWKISGALLKQLFGFRQFRLLNDFALMTEGVSRLTPDDCLPVRGHRPIDLRTMNVAVMGAGTGWGTGFSLRQQGSAPTLHVSESGHCCLPQMIFDDPELARANEAVVAGLQRRFVGSANQDAARPAGVVVENIISGTGLRNVYTILSGREIPLNVKDMVGALDIEERAKNGDPLARRTFQIFNAYIGKHIGNVACSSMLDAVVLSASFKNKWMAEQLAADPLFHHNLTANRAGMKRPLENLVVVAAQKELPPLGLQQYASRLRATDNEMQAVTARLTERSTKVNQVLTQLLALSRLPELSQNAHVQHSLIETYRIVEDLLPRTQVPADKSKLPPSIYWKQPGRDPRG